MVLKTDVKEISNTTGVIYIYYIYIIYKVHEDFSGRLEVEAWGPGLNKSKEKFLLEVTSSSRLPLSNIVWLQSQHSVKATNALTLI